MSANETDASMGLRIERQSGERIILDSLVRRYIIDYTVLAKVTNRESTRSLMIYPKWMRWNGKSRPTPLGPPILAANKRRPREKVIWVNWKSKQRADVRRHNKITVNNMYLCPLESDRAATVQGTKNTLVADSFAFFRQHYGK